MEKKSDFACVISQCLTHISWFSLQKHTWIIKQNIYSESAQKTTSSPYNFIKKSETSFFMKLYEPMNESLISSHIFDIYLWIYSKFHVKLEYVFRLILQILFIGKMSTYVSDFENFCCKSHSVIFQRNDSQVFINKLCHTVVFW